MSLYLFYWTSFAILLLVLAQAGYSRTGEESLGRGVRRIAKGLRGSAGLLVLIAAAAFAALGFMLPG